MSSHAKKARTLSCFSQAISSKVYIEFGLASLDETTSACSLYGKYLTEFTPFSTFPKNLYNTWAVEEILSRDKYSQI